MRPPALDPCHRQRQLIAVSSSNASTTARRCGSSGLGKLLYSSTTFVGLLARNTSRSPTQQYQQPRASAARRHVAAAAALLPSFSYSNNPHSLSISRSVGSIFLGSISVAALLVLVCLRVPRAAATPQYQQSNSLLTISFGSEV